MDDMILGVNTLPYPLHCRIRSEKVRIHEENGVIILVPIGETIANDNAFTIPENFQPKEKRREILRSLIGSVDEPIVIEPLKAARGSPIDWEMMDQ